MHWDGTKWTPSPSGSKARLYGIWAEDKSNAWAVGEEGTILHWDGIAWHASQSGTHDDLHGIWAAVAEDVWVVGFSPKTGSTATRRRKLR
jgi:hypothetical protein